MTSNPHKKEAFVWIWLPGETQPVVAGKLEADNGTILRIPVKKASRTDVKAATIPLRKRPVFRREKGQCQESVLGWI